MVESSMNGAQSRQRSDENLSLSLSVSEIKLSPSILKTIIQMTKSIYDYMIYNIDGRIIVTVAAWLPFPSRLTNDLRS